MASSELISGWGNGGWGQVSWGKDLLLVSVDGNLAESAVGSVDAQAGSLVELLGQTMTSELGSVTVDLGSLVPLVGVGAQVIAGDLYFVVWSRVDDSQSAVWQGIGEPANAWSNIESAPAPDWTEIFT